MHVEQLLEAQLAVRIWEEDDPILTAISAPIEDNEFGPQLKEFGLRLADKMQAANGLGLAGPQVGLSKRIFAMTLPQDDSKSLVVCNPQLTLDGNPVFAQEGCLSLPGVFEQVGRAPNVVMRFYHPDGCEDEMELTGLDARVAQHEADHLDGVMFFDRRRVSKQVQKQILRNWEKQKNRLGL